MCGALPSLSYLLIVTLLCPDVTLIFTDPQVHCGHHGHGHTRLDTLLLCLLLSPTLVGRRGGQQFHRHARHHARAHQWRGEARALRIRLKPVQEICHQGTKVSVIADYHVVLLFLPAVA